jgi:hypothetical protein
MIIENISARVSGLCGRMKVSQKQLPVQYWIPAHFRSLPGFYPIEFDGFRNRTGLYIACAERAGATVLIAMDDAPEKQYESPQRIFSIRIVNPAAWYEEVHGNEREDTTGNS